MVFEGFTLDGTVKKARPPIFDFLVDVPFFGPLDF
jgi:hypothetical protein